MDGDIKVLGIDLAKNVFQLHGVDENECCIYKKRLNKTKLIETLSNFWDGSNIADFSEHLTS